ncbi:MAG: pentapeptide repeat-containing protein [Pseudomonadota bacterium]
MSGRKKQIRRVKRSPRAPERVGAGNDDVLDHIAKVSQNARAIWFGLLALLAFVTVTLMTHQDADFYAVDAATKLPVVNIDVPPLAFFIAAPVLTATLYCYLHLYLINLWDALADAPPRAGGEPLSERIFPTLLSHAALWYRNRMRGDRSAPDRAMGAAMAMPSIVLAWGYGIVVMALLFLASLPRHHELLGFWTGLCLGITLVIGIATFNVMRRRMARRDRNIAHRPWGRAQRGNVARLAILLAGFSWLSTGGIEQPIRWLGHLPNDPPTDLQRWDDHREWYEFGWHDTDPDAWRDRKQPWYETVAGFARATLAPVKMAEARLTRRPDDWLTYSQWVRDFRAQYLKARGWQWDHAFSDQERQAFDTEKREYYHRYLDLLAAPVLEGADLRQADLQRAYLPNADLEGARLQGADLRGAEMQGADLRGARVSDSKCTRAAFLAALVHFADITCAKGSLNKGQLALAVGNVATGLPQDRYVRNCLDEDDPEVFGKVDEIDAALSHIPDTVTDDERHFLVKLSHQDVRDLLFCKPGQHSFKLTYDPWEQRFHYSDGSLK